MIKYKSNFVGTEFTELASTPASADLPVLPSSSATPEGPIHHVPQPSSESVPGPSFTATNKRKRFTRKKPSDKFSGSQGASSSQPQTVTSPEGKKIYLCQQWCNQSQKKKRL